MLYKIFHETTFKYSSMVTFNHNIARLKPIPNRFQSLESYELEIDPVPYSVEDHLDFFGNTNTKIFIKKAHEKLTVTAHSHVKMDLEAIEEHMQKTALINISFAELKEYLKNSSLDVLEAKQFLFPSLLIPFANKEIREYTLLSFQSEPNLYKAIHNFMQRIFEDFEFVSGFSDITTPIETIFAEKKGVCQDFASLAISALRSLGIPTRYASGYIQTYPNEGEEKLFGSDASHAWFSVFLGAYGWVDFDPTNNKIPNHEYTLLGYGRDYHDICPLKGVVQSSGSSALKVRVNVEEVKD